ncbi:unnamed protein product [Lathyrus sativus]|nr:unnamed protein product [Lathyrus sativus]
MLNGATYPTLVKDFWVRAEVYDEYSAQDEERNVVEKDRSLKGKSRAEMGLKEFKGVEIRSDVMGLDINVTQENIVHLIGAENKGMVIINKKDGG